MRTAVPGGSFEAEATDRLTRELKAKDMSKRTMSGNPVLE